MIKQKYCISTNEKREIKVEEKNKKQIDGNKQIKKAKPKAINVLLLNNIVLLEYKEYSK